MRLKTRTIAGGLVVAGVVLGSFMSGLLPGMGSGSGTAVQVSAVSETVPTPDIAPDAPLQDPEPVEPPEAASVSPTQPAAVLEVRIDDHSYLVPENGSTGFRQAELDDIVRLAQATTGNDDGIRVRIVRTRSARFAAWSALYDSLEKSGLSRDSIRMPKELIE